MSLPLCHHEKLRLYSKCMHAHSRPRVDNPNAGGPGRVKKQAIWLFIQATGELHGLQDCSTMRLITKWNQLLLNQTAIAGILAALIRRVIQIWRSTALQHASCRTPSQPPQPLAALEVSNFRSLLIYYYNLILGGCFFSFSFFFNREYWLLKVKVNQASSKTTSGTLPYIAHH